jgi:unsaturated rhamnogalacturonyl hydrolase
MELGIQTGDAALSDFGRAFADSQWKATTPDGLTTQARYWIDDVWMIGALQVQAFRVSRDPKYLDRAALMARLYMERLQQSNGLFFHGPKARFHWARGNGWVAAGLAELLSELPPGHKDYRAVMGAYQRMMKGLLSHQAEDGMWRQLIDYPKSWKETSGTAMFAYAMVVGHRRGILTDPAYTQAYVKAWAALALYVEPNGSLREVCVGTGQSESPQYYLDRPRKTGDFHGQAPLLWFATALLA